MAYIGTKPTVGNFQICDAISVVNGQAAYTMQVGSVNVIPQSANHMIVSLNGTIQKPNSSFTVSGSTITFASNLATGDVIDFIQILGDVLDLGVPSDATVTTAKLADSSVSLAKLTATGTKSSSTFLRGDNTFNTPPLGGITETDQYRLTANITSDTNPISSNLERVDNASFGKIGTGMSLSSGIFTFPSTGLYHVMYTFRSLSSASDTIAGEIYVTQNNSSYEVVSSTANGDGGSSRVNTGNCIAFVNVTDTANVKVKFAIASITSGTVQGDTNYNLTCFSFIRLGDSV
jgi:hypothetical protein